MSSPSPLRLRVWKDGVAEALLPLAEPGAVCTVDLRCLPGASGVHLVLLDDQGVRLRAEVAADSGETVPIQVELDGNRRPHVSSEGRKLMFLPVEARYDPPPPIQPLPADAPIDLAFVIDGTIRNWSDNRGCLLDNRDLWSAHVAKLIEFAAKLTEGRDWRAAVVAFGDQDPPAVTATDLLPKYRLKPDGEQTLQQIGLDQLRDRLAAVEATPGGDFVDALSDALAACAGMRWRKGRKVVVVSGDSPGASLLYPLPREADLCVRRLDVDTEATRLYRQGVEVTTIYHAPPAELNLQATKINRLLLGGARAQYLRLASLPNLAFEAAEFNATEAAERLEQATRPIGRDTALGELLQVGPL